MTSRVCILLLSTALAVAAEPLLAQEPSAADRLSHVAELNSLDGASMKPWHLKLSYQHFGDAGQPDKTGTIEEWWSTPQTFRIVQTEGSSKNTYLSVSGARYQSSLGASLSSDLQELLDHVVHPVLIEGGEDVKLEAHVETFGKTKYTCIALIRKTQGSHPMEVFGPKHCVADNDYLRISFSVAEAFVNNELGTFQGHEVPTKVSLSNAGVRILDTQLAALSIVPVEAVDLSTAGLVPAPALARISSGVVAGLKLGGDVPEYPEDARDKHLSGTVVLHAVIGTDGAVRDLQVLSSPANSLSMSALKAVRTWRYRPYLLEGKAVPVDTTITVNFNLRLGGFRPLP